MYMEHRVECYVGYNMTGYVIFNWHFVVFESFLLILCG